MSDDPTLVALASRIDRRTVFAPTPQAGTIPMTQEARAILEWIDGERSAEEIAAGTGMQVFALACIAWLADAGAVTAVGGGAPVAAFPGAAGPLPWTPPTNAAPSAQIPSPSPSPSPSPLPSPSPSPSPSASPSPQPPLPASTPSSAPSLDALASTMVPTPPAASGPNAMRDAALAAERAGKPDEALAIVSRAIAQWPDRANLHALRARMLIARGETREAAGHAARAAALEPGNATYRDVAVDYAKRAGLAAPPDVRAPMAAAAAPPARTPMPPPSGIPALPSSAPRPARVRTPAEKAAGAVGGLILAVIAAWNVWYWAVRPMRNRPRPLDTRAASAFVPLTRLQSYEGTAYGTVSPSWASLPEREKKVAALANRLEESAGTHQLVLVDGANRIVARSSGAGTTIYERVTVTPAPSSPSPSPTASTIASPAPVQPL